MNNSTTSAQAAAIDIFTDAWKKYIDEDSEKIDNTVSKAMYQSFIALLKTHPSYDPETDLFNGVSEFDWVYDMDQNQDNNLLSDFYESSTDPSRVIGLIAVQMYDYLNTVSRWNKALKMITLGDTVAYLVTFHPSFDYRTHKLFSS
jgi:hypothetical protein